MSTEMLALSVNVQLYMFSVIHRVHSARKVQLPKNAEFPSLGPIYPTSLGKSLVCELELTYVQIVKCV